MWKARGELGPSFLPGLVSQLLPYCPVAPLPVLRQTKAVPVAAWRGMAEVVKRMDYESSSDIDVSLGP